MPPANRHKPKRAASSDSDYSITEFMQEFRTHTERVLTVLPRSTA